MQLEFLTREGCSRTSVLLERLEDALGSLDPVLGFTIVDQAELGGEDPRRGYPTPTILIAGRDLFGLPQPTPPFPEPS